MLNIFNLQFYKISEFGEIIIFSPTNSQLIYLFLKKEVVFVFVNVFLNCHPLRVRY